MHLCIFFFHCSKYFICSYQVNNSVHFILSPTESPPGTPTKSSQPPLCWSTSNAPASVLLSQPAQRAGEGEKLQPCHSQLPFLENPIWDTKPSDPTYKKAAATGRGMAMVSCHLLSSRGFDHLVCRDTVGSLLSCPFLSVQAPHHLLSVSWLVVFVCSFVLFCFVPFLTFPPSLSVLFPFTLFLLTFPNFSKFSLLPYPFCSLPNLAPRLIFLLKVLYRKNYGANWK